MSDWDMTPHEIFLCDDCADTTYSLSWDSIRKGEHDNEPTAGTCGVCDAHGARVEALGYRY
jgi:hypothetical protein